MTMANQKTGYTVNNINSLTRALVNNPTLRVYLYLHPGVCTNPFKTAVCIKIEAKYILLILLPDKGRGQHCGYTVSGLPQCNEVIHEYLTRQPLLIKN